MSSSLSVSDIFRCTALSVLCRYFRNKDRPPWKQQKKEWHRERKRERERDRQREYGHICTSSLCVPPARTCTCLCFSSRLEFLNKVSRSSVILGLEHFHPSRLGLMSQSPSRLIYHVRCFTFLATSDEAPYTLVMIISLWFLISNNLRIHFMCNIFPKNWWAVKASLPLTLCWHVQSLQLSVNLTLHIHQRQASCQTCPWASETPTKC